MGILITVFTVVGIILAFIAQFSDPTMWLCVGVAFFQSGIWGLLLYILYRIAVTVGCVTENPAGPQPPSSSSSALRSYGDAHTPDQSSLGLAPYRIEDQIGLGDIVKRATGAMGIQPCQKCHERAARLNQWVSITGRRIEESGK
jgi:hypothetical protein